MKKGNVPGHVFILLFFLLSGFCNAQIITTITGNGTNGFSGDGGVATAAEINGPGGNTLFDNAGNAYFCDQNNTRIREINASGIIQTIAGTGAIGYSGDGGAATNAEFNQNTVITFDSSGNMYVADFGNDCIRKINALGIISTFAGTGTPGYSGNGGPATAAELNWPCCVIADNAGNIYIADSWNNVIRKVDSKGIITLFAGTGVGGYGGDGGLATLAELNHPFRIIFDKKWNMYIADSFNSRIRKIDNSGVITTIAGTGAAGFGGDGGPATSAELDEPYGVCVDALGNIFIADAFNNRIREVNSSGIISTIAGTGTAGYGGDGGPAVAAELDFPVGISFHECSLYIDDWNNDRIRKITFSSMSLAASKDTICPGDSAILTASGGNSYTWAPAAGLSCTNCPNPVASPSVTTTYTVTGTVSGPCGGTAIDSVKVIVAKFSLNNLTITKDTAICNGSSITLSAGGGYSYNWNTGATTSSIVLTKVSTTQTYTVNIQNEACKEDTALSVSVTVLSSPKISLSGNAKICQGDSIQLNVSGASSYKWSNGYTGSAYAATINSITTLTVTAYNSSGCSHDTSITIAPDIPVLSACCNETITIGSDTTLIASGNTRKPYQWSPEVICINPPLCDSVKVSPTVTTTYTVTMTDSLGCQIEKILTVLVETPCFNFIIPNVFTPDYAGALGVNNVFYIKTTNLDDWSISIYDRWGIEMFHSTNPSQYWNGNTENGGKAPDGVYYYIISATCQNNSYKKDGFLQLIR